MELHNGTQSLMGRALIKAELLFSKFEDLQPGEGTTQLLRFDQPGHLRGASGLMLQLPWAVANEDQLSPRFKCSSSTAENGGPQIWWQVHPDGHNQIKPLLELITVREIQLLLLETDPALNGESSGQLQSF